jgi:ribosomal protein L11 methyltransferase
MRWMRFKIRTTTEAEDILVSAMEDLGLYGAQIEDHVPLTAQEKEQMFVDIMPDGPADDGSAVLSFYVEESGDGKLTLPQESGEAPSEDNAALSGGSVYSIPGAGGRTVTPDALKASIEAKIAELKTYSDVIGEGAVTIEQTEDIDWMNSWKQYFHQFWIDDILVIPSWEQPAAPQIRPAYTFHIDPGTAFGTGAHETTQLCIRQIRRFLTPETELLDVGTGSGILSLLALMMGARHAVGTDLDPMAPPAIEQNCRANGIATDRLEVILGNLVNDPAVQDRVGRERYDIVAANILPDVLVPLTPAAIAALKRGGVYITSGIVQGREHEVEQAMQAGGLQHLVTTRQGEWCCVVGQKT